MNEVRHSEEVKPLAVSVLSGQGLFVWVVFNINGDLIGVASSETEAERIFNERYPGDEPYMDSIKSFEVNKFHYA